MAEKDPIEEKRKELKQKLTKNQGEIEEILSFILEGKTSESLQREVEEAMALVEEHAEGKVFHDHKGKRVPLHHHSSRLLRLIKKMEDALKIDKYGPDLHKSLSCKCRHRVRMLQEMKCISGPASDSKT